MSRPPIDLDDTAEVLAAIGAIPLRVRPRHTDLMVMIAGPARLSGTLLLVDDVPNGLPQHERVKSLGRMWHEIRIGVPDTAAASVALCRNGLPEQTGEDLAWHDAIRATAAQAGITCLGVYVATQRGVAQVVPSAA